MLDKKYDTQVMLFSSYEPQKVDLFDYYNFIYNFNSVKKMK
jgi:hypothetical protein